MAISFAVSSYSQSHRSTPKSRLFSTLDPELMLHPEALPRANTVSMTTEYSFLRTSVPRGPKLGSLGIPPSKEKRTTSRSPRPSKIHSLADYKSQETPTGAGGGDGSRTSADASMFSHGSSLSSVSTLSEVSVLSEFGSSETDARPPPSLQPADTASEVDGSESGARPGDGNDSDSSSYSSASARGPAYGLLSAAVGRQGAAYTVEGREIAAEAMGQFPSLREVLQAASDERQHLGGPEQDGEAAGEPRSRRDSFSSR